jgi:hypothetical protein
LRLLHEHVSDCVVQSSHASPGLPVGQALSAWLVAHWLRESQHPLGQLFASQVAAPLLLPPLPLPLPLPPASRDARQVPKRHRAPIVVQFWQLAPSRPHCESVGVPTHIPPLQHPRGHVCGLHPPRFPLPLLLLLLVLLPPLLLPEPLPLLYPLLEPLPPKSDPLPEPPDQASAWCPPSVVSMSPAVPPSSE